MNSGGPLVLDANILLRAVFGVRVLQVIKRYKEDVLFCVPDLCFVEARKHALPIALRRGMHPARGLGILDDLEQALEIVDHTLYASFEEEARARISRRDPDDWPILATALLLDCPLWTEDRDFFGTGIATWTTDNIELYLRPRSSVRP